MYKVCSSIQDLFIVWLWHSRVMAVKVSTIWCLIRFECARWYFCSSTVSHHDEFLLLDPAIWIAMLAVVDQFLQDCCCLCYSSWHTNWQLSLYLSIHPLQRGLVPQRSSCKYSHLPLQGIPHSEFWPSTAHELFLSCPCFVWELFTHVFCWSIRLQNCSWNIVTGIKLCCPPHHNDSHMITVRIFFVVS